MGTIPKQYKKEIGDALIAESVTGWKCGLLKSTFVYDPATDITWTDVLPHEIVIGTGYTTGGYAVTLSGAYDGSDYVVDAVNVASPANSTFSDVGFAVLYRTSDGKIRDIKTINPVAAVVAGTFTIQWSASGLIKIS